MAAFALTADELLAGAAVVYEVPVPPEILRPQAGGADELRGQQAPPAEGATVRLRPLTIGTFQLIMRAARSDAGLIPLLMIKESLVDPELTLEQVRRMHLGLVNFLIEHIREISGLSKKKGISTS